MIPARFGLRRPLSLAVLACAILSSLVCLSTSPAAAGPPGAIGDLYVTNDIDNVCRQYDGTTGVQVGPFFANAGAEGQMAIHYGESNNRVLIGHLSGGVEEYNADTGAYIKTYNPGGGWQWAGIYAPNGNVLIGDQSTNDVREYDSTTGAFISVLTTVDGPADMRIGPNGNLFICSYVGSYVKEVDVDTGAFVDQWSQTFGDRTNDIAFLPSGEILVTAMASNVCYRYDSAKNLLGTFAGTGWGRVHGIDLSPWDGNIYIADGITAQVHVFDPVSFTELNPAFLSPAPQSKIVDPAFRPEPGPVSVDSESWGSIKERYR
jgi:WD40 repeat protein